MRLRALVVDDDKRVLQAIARSLRAEGFDVATAPSGEHVSGVLQHDVFDVVLTDIWMPGGDGFFVVSEVARLRPGLPVVMISGLPRAREIDRAKELGVVAVFAKPFDMDELIATLRAACTRS